MSRVPASWTLFIDRLSYLFALCVVPSFFLLLLSASSKDNKPVAIPKVLSISFIFLAAITFTPLLIKRVVITPEFEETPGPLYLVFVFYFLSWLFYGLIKMFKAFKESDGFKKNQLKYFLFSLLIAFLAAINYFVCIFFPDIPPTYYLVEFLYTILVAYSVIRYKLMDFDLLVRWGLTVAALLSVSLLLIAMLVTVIGLTSRFFKLSPGVPVLFFVMGLFLFYERIKKASLIWIDKFIYQSPDLAKIITEVETILSKHTSLESFSSELVIKFKEIWLVDHVGFAIWSPEKSIFAPTPVNEFNSYPILKPDVQITKADFLVKTLETERRLFYDGIVTVDEINSYGNRSSQGEKITFWKMRRSMEWLGAFICVPMIHSEQLIGFLVMGEKRNKSPYNNEDKKILSYICVKLTEALKDLIFKKKLEGGIR